MSSTTRIQRTKAIYSPRSPDGGQGTEMCHINRAFRVYGSNILFHHGSLRILNNLPTEGPHSFANSAAKHCQHHTILPHSTNPLPSPLTSSPLSFPRHRHSPRLQQKDHRNTLNHRRSHTPSSSSRQQLTTNTAKHTYTESGTTGCNRIVSAAADARLVVASSRC
jgi:hypothetical protein